MNQQPDHIDETLLLRYFLDQTDVEDRKLVENWLSQDSNRQEYEQRVRIWQTADAIEDFEKIDVEANWQKFQKNMVQEEKRSYSWLKIAAVFIALAVASFMLLRNSFDEVSDLEFVAEGNNELLELSDGTKVWLKEGASLTYPESFSGAIREVTFEGEALFEVAKNSQMPFIIKAMETTTEVLGTSFNLKSEEGKGAELVLIEGKVKFSTPSEQVILMPGQGVVLNENGLMTKTQNQNRNYLSWRTGKFEFDNDSMDKVMKDLSNAFNFNYQFNSESFKSCLLTAKFEKEDLSEILLTLETLFGASFDQNADQLMIIGGQCN